MKTEKQLHLYMKAACKQHEILFYKLHAEGRRGFPDLMLARAGAVHFVELKSPSKTGKLSRLQIETIAALELEKVNVHVIDSKEQADEIIKRLSA